MLIVDRLDGSTNYNYAVRGYWAYGFEDRRGLRTGLSNRAQTENTSHCEQEYALQDSSYRQIPALLRWTFVFLSVSNFKASTG